MRRWFASERRRSTGRSGCVQTSGRIVSLLPAQFPIATRFGLCHGSRRAPGTARRRRRRRPTSWWQMAPQIDGQMREKMRQRQRDFAPSHGRRRRGRSLDGWRRVGRIGHRQQRQQRQFQRQSKQHNNLVDFVTVLSLSLSLFIFAWGISNDVTGRRRDEQDRVGVSRHLARSYRVLYSTPNLEVFFSVGQEFYFVVLF